MLYSNNADSVLYIFLKNINIPLLLKAKVNLIDNLKYKASSDFKVSS